LRQGVPSVSPADPSGRDAPDRITSLQLVNVVGLIPEGVSLRSRTIEDDLPTVEEALDDLKKAWSDCQQAEEHLKEKLREFGVKVG